MTRNQPITMNLWAIKMLSISTNVLTPLCVNHTFGASVDETIHFPCPIPTLIALQFCSELPKEADDGIMVHSSILAFMIH